MGYFVYNIKMAIDTFKEFLKQNNLPIEILISTEPTRTALEAATTHNVPVSNIVKSLLVKSTNGFLLFLVPGDRRLDLDRLKKDFNDTTLSLANADEVKEITGYSIGGVPPFGHISKIKTYIEEGFDQNTEVVAAAGSGNAVFKTTLDNLKEYITL
jgi:prolyl-tRNA editing enzyme YbaK/EbsC (Cys-tRNA(Pro) deacylase)